MSPVRHRIQHVFSHLYFQQCSFIAASFSAYMHDNVAMILAGADKESAVPAPAVTFTFDVEMRSAGGKGGVSVAIVRRRGQLDPAVSLSSQIFICQVNDAAPLGMFFYSLHG
jgi:hypothetical protein